MFGRHSIVAGGLLLSCASACSSPAGDVGSQEQHGTAGQDVEVARLRHAFAGAELPLDLAHSGTPLATSLGISASPAVHFVLQCERRDATLDAAPAATPTTYGFVTSGDDELVGVDAAHAGAPFVRDDQPNSNELLGYQGNFVSGALGHYAAVRVASTGEVLVEELVRPTVESLPPADSATWESLRESHQASVAGQGLALAYTRCSSRQVFLYDGHVALFDDFRSPAYSRQVWANAFGPTAFQDGGYDLSQGPLQASVADSIVRIDFDYRNVNVPMTVSVGADTITIGDGRIQTPGGLQQDVVIPTSGHVAMTFQQGLILVLLDNGKGWDGVYDPAAAPFVYQGSPASVVLSASSGTLGTVLFTVP
jgi:hypothetical protein